MMVFTWTRKCGRRNGRKKVVLEGISNNNVELTIPTLFRCPICLDLMKDPVTLSTGITYDRESIERWIDAGNSRCPVTNQVLQSPDLIPNHSLRKMIQYWCMQNKSHGIERIPTPRIPITPHQVSEICGKILSAASYGDESKCRDLLGKIQRLAKESERNKRCIVENGTGCVLSASYESFASISMERHSDLLKYILSLLTWIFPLGEEGLSKLGCATSLRCMAWFLKSEDLSAKQNALLVLKELFSLNITYVDRVVEIEDTAETLFKIVEIPICPAATKASLMIIYFMMSGSDDHDENVTQKFVEMGLISLVIEILVDGERTICEKALVVLDSLCNCREGKRIASNNALTIPVVVKKLLRVSNVTTEFSVSLLWKLCKEEKDDEKLVIEALQACGFQKLLLVLQVGFSQETKEKATELLKLMNLHKDKVECYGSSSGFKYIRSSY